MTGMKMILMKMKEAEAAVHAIVADMKKMMILKTQVVAMDEMKTRVAVETMMMKIMTDMAMAGNMDVQVIPDNMEIQAVRDNVDVQVVRDKVVVMMILVNRVVMETWETAAVDVPAIPVRVRMKIIAI